MFFVRGGYGARQTLMTNSPGPLLNLQTCLRRCINYRTLNRAHCISRPVESHSGAWGNHIVGPYHNLIPEAPRSRRRKRRKGGNLGRGVPSLSNYWERRPANGFYAYLRSERSHLEVNILFSIFERLRAPFDGPMYLRRGEAASFDHTPLQGESKK